MVMYQNTITRSFITYGISYPSSVHFEVCRRLSRTDTNTSICSQSQNLCFICVTVICEVDVEFRLRLPSCVIELSHLERGSHTITIRITLATEMHHIGYISTSTNNRCHVGHS